MECGVCMLHHHMYAVQAQVDWCVWPASCALLPHRGTSVGIRFIITIVPPAKLGGWAGVCGWIGCM